MAAEPKLSQTAIAEPRSPIADDNVQRVRPDPMPRLTEPVEATTVRPKSQKPLVLPEQASGRFSTARGAGELAESATTYEVTVEIGLPVKARSFAKAVTRTLDDPRSWQSGTHQLQRTAIEGDFRVVLASPETADRLCAPLDTGGRLSCRNGRDVVINAWRWANGAESYAGNLRQYRHYVINHEVGHALGYGHQDCPEPGAPAPVMVQQTKGLQGCAANPWPAAADLP